MLLLLDNYDSFTYNLAQYLGELGASPLVRRNDEIGLDDIERLSPRYIVVSPGPGRPEDAGISIDVIQRFGPRVPLLGVCLGHQAIASAFGGRVVRAQVLMHGKTSMIEHDGKGVFRGIRGPFEVGRYHSLIVSDDGLPDDLEVAARTVGEGTIMAIRHRRFPVHGVQFHPESVLTGEGRHMLRSFLEI